MYFKKIIKIGCLLTEIFKREVDSVFRHSVQFNVNCNKRRSCVQGEPFYVDTGALGFSVVMFCIGASATAIILIVRRFSPALGLAELGGPLVPKIITGTMLFVIYIAYVLISSLQAYDHIKVNL